MRVSPQRINKVIVLAVLNVRKLKPKRWDITHIRLSALLIHTD